jgi:hypothetical protein
MDLVGRLPTDETVVVDIEAIERSEQLALGSRVRDLRQLEDQLQAAGDLDTALRAYLEERAAATPAPPPKPEPARIVVRTDDRLGPRRR